MSMDPQEVTEHDYPHDDEDCNACGGTEQIEIVFQDHSRDYVGCPVCIAREKNETIAAKDAEIERLRAALKPFAEIAAGIPTSDSNAKPFAHVGQDTICKGTFTSITVGHLRAAADAVQQTAVCAKCGKPTSREEALVNGEIWCHPCADSQ